MSKELLLFEFETKQLRATEVNGEVWLILKDVCDNLGVKPSHVSRFLDADEILKSPDMGIRIPKVNRGMILVNESGLYKVIFRSDKKEAKAFTRWVTKEVLPTIRKTGGYINPLLKENENTIALIREESNRNRERYLNTKELSKERKYKIQRLQNRVNYLENELRINSDVVSKLEFEMFADQIDNKLNRILLTIGELDLEDI